MRKNNNYTKTIINYSINKDLLKEFNRIAKEKAINKSGLIELYIKKWVEEQKTINILT